MQKTLQRPHEAEDEYFARLEVEKKCKIAEKRRAEMEQKEIETLKRIHARRCADCGQALETIVFKGISVNKCFHCGGAYLSRQAFQKLCGRDHQFLNLFMEIFQFSQATAYSKILS